MQSDQLRRELQCLTRRQQGIVRRIEEAKLIRRLVGRQRKIRARPPGATGSLARAVIRGRRIRIGFGGGWEIRIATAGGIIENWMALSTE